jgi:beta-N-acetylhexosaminidase
MMVGHANYPALDDSGSPSSLSRKIIHGILREEWGYRGAVISDDLDMGAIVGHYGWPNRSPARSRRATISCCSATGPN